MQTRVGTQKHKKVYNLSWLNVNDVVRGLHKAGLKLYRNGLGNKRKSLKKIPLLKILISPSHFSHSRMYRVFPPPPPGPFSLFLKDIKSKVFLNLGCFRTFVYPITKIVL